MTSAAFLALWNGIASPAHEPEYEAWHSIEHVPERVGLPGFVRGQRYRTVRPDGPGTRYFTCYSLASREALATPAYRDVFTHPTAWSARMRGSLTGFFRLPCDRLGTAGAVSGRYLAPLHLVQDGADVAAFEAALATHASQLADRGAVLRAQWGRAMPSDDFPLANATGPAARACVVLLEHLDLAALEDSADALSRAMSSWARPGHPTGMYEWLTDVHHADLPPAPVGPTGFSRQPARNDLMDRHRGARDPAP